jgi:hypothetical protein
MERGVASRARRPAMNTPRRRRYAELRFLLGCWRRGDVVSAGVDANALRKTNGGVLFARETPKGRSKQDNANPPVRLRKPASGQKSEHPSNGSRMGAPIHLFIAMVSLMLERRTHDTKVRPRSCCEKVHVVSYLIVRRGVRRIAAIRQRYN